MAGAGREGKFTPFLRDKLGWSEKYAYRKAMRWKAAHMYRVGLIDKDAYDKEWGNGSSTLRTASEPDEATPPAVPALCQTYTIEVDPSVPPLCQPDFSPEEIGADVEALEKRKDGFFKTVLYRAMYPVALAKWFDSAWRLQAKRHGTKTFAETLAAILFIGTKHAEPGDDWEEIYDEILRDIGHNHALVLQHSFVHPEERDEVEDEFFAEPTPEAKTDAEVEASGEEKTPNTEEITLDDFDGPPCW